MLKKITYLSLLTITLLSGCYSFDATPIPLAEYGSLAGDNGLPKEHVIVENYGWYLFNTVPLITGDTAGDTRGSMSFFSDEVTLDKLQHNLMLYAKEKGYRCADLTVDYNATCMLSMVPYVGTTFGILWYKELQVSANLIYHPTKKQQTLKKEMDEILNNIPEGGTR